MCELINKPEVMPGRGCCKCRIYNGLQRKQCRGCGAALCEVEIPAEVLRCACGFGYRPGMEEVFPACPVCGALVPSGADERQGPDLSIIVCAPTAWGNPGGFVDSVVGSCEDCKEEISWRPHMPAGMHLCVSCAMKRGAPDKVMLTPKTALELAEYVEQARELHASQGRRDS